MMPSEKGEAKEQFEFGKSLDIRVSFYVCAKKKTAEDKLTEGKTLPKLLQLIQSNYLKFFTISPSRFSSFCSSSHASSALRYVSSLNDTATGIIIRSAYI